MIIHSPSTKIISQKTGFAGSKTVFRQSMVFERCSGVAARTGISILVQKRGYSYKKRNLEGG